MHHTPIFSEYIYKKYVLVESGKIKKVWSLRKGQIQEVFWGWNWDFLRCFEPDPEKSHSYKKECICFKPLQHQFYFGNG